MKCLAKVAATSATSQFPAMSGTAEWWGGVSECVVVALPTIEWGELVEDVSLAAQDASLADHRVVVLRDDLRVRDQMKVL